MLAWPSIFKEYHFFKWSSLSTFPPPRDGICNLVVAQVPKGVWPPNVDRQVMCCLRTLALAKFNLTLRRQVMLLWVAVSISFEEPVFVQIENCIYWVQCTLSSSLHDQYLRPCLLGFGFFFDTNETGFHCKNKKRTQPQPQVAWGLGQSLEAPAKLNWELVRPRLMCTFIRELYICE